MVPKKATISFLEKEVIFDERVEGTKKVLCFTNEDIQKIGGEIGSHLEKNGIKFYERSSNFDGYDLKHFLFNECALTVRYDWVCGHYRGFCGKDPRAPMDSMWIGIYFNKKEKAEETVNNLLTFTRISEYNPKITWE